MLRGMPAVSLPRLTTGPFQFGERSATAFVDGLSLYAADPAGFGREVLGEAYTPDVIRMMESVRDYPVTVARSSNAVGKTHGAARVAVWFYKVYGDAQVYTAAAPPEANLKRLLWGEIGGLIARHPALFANDRVISLHVERNPQSFLTGVTIPLSGTSDERQAKFSGKHAPHLLFILDEGDAIPVEVYRGIESCMSGGHARLLVMMNPRNQSGPVWNLERDRRANVVELTAFRHPNVVEGRDVIPGAVNRETVVRRINEWSRAVVSGEDPGREGFDVPSYLAGATAHSQSGLEYPPLPEGKRKATDPAFFYMVLGQYPPEGESQLISREWIEQAHARWYAWVAAHGETPPNMVRPILGLDVAEFGRDLNALAMRYGGWVPPLLAWNGVDTDETAIRAARYAQEAKALRMGVDATGVGAGVAARARRLGFATAFEVKVATSPTKKPNPNEPKLGEFGLLRDQLWWSMREWLRTDPSATLPPNEELDEELATPTYHVQKGKLKIMPKDTMKELLGRSPDHAEALMLTFAEPDGRGPARVGPNPLAGYRG